MSAEAVALNPVDLTVGTGVFHGGHPPLPYVPGGEAVGRTKGGERHPLDAVVGSAWARQRGPGRLKVVVTSIQEAG